MLADSECACRKFCCRQIRFSVMVDAHLAEIEMESRFHEGSCLRIERLALRMENPGSRRSLRHVMRGRYLGAQWKSPMHGFLGKLIGVFFRLVAGSTHGHRGLRLRGSSRSWPELTLPRKHSHGCAGPAKATLYTTHHQSTTVGYFSVLHLGACA